jgi:hypothetical protein
MSWEQRFMEAWAALLAMEARAERAELALRKAVAPASEWERNRQQAAACKKLLRGLGR